MSDGQLVAEEVADAAGIWVDLGCRDPAFKQSHFLCMCSRHTVRRATPLSTAEFISERRNVLPRHDHLRGDVEIIVFFCVLPIERMPGSDIT